MTTKGTISTILFVLVYTVGLAQVKPADLYFEQKKYDKALNLYLQASEKDPNDLHVTQQLGHCLYRLGRYPEAKKYFKRASLQKLAENDVYLYLGKCLKFENKIYEAKTQFEEYVKREDDPRGKIEVASCERIIDEWSKKPYSIQVQNVEGMNSEFIDMAPSMYRGKLSFTSDLEKKGKKEKQLEKLEVDPTDIYIYDPSNSEEPIKAFSDAVNTRNGGEGPGFFDAEGKVFFYTKVTKDPSKAVNQMELHIVNYEKEKWVEGPEFTKNSFDYSVGYPVISKDGQYIFFSSDRPKGDGVWNIYAVKRRGSIGFMSPKKIKGNINTKGNEFPCYVDENNVMYFASDYHPGYGGLDIFKTQLSLDESNYWTGTEPVNLGAPVNTGADDHYYILTGEKTGYFASNRKGGKGDFDIYSFEYRPFTETDYYKNLSGSYTDGSNPIAGTTLIIQDRTGEIIRSVNTDSRGEFHLKNVPQRDDYIVSVDADPTTIPSSGKITISNDDNGKKTVLSRLENGEFKFESLPLEGAAELALEPEEDMPTIVVMGQVEGGDFAGQEIHVVDSEGNVIASTVIDRLGKFKFEKLKADEQYLFQLDEDDSSMKISIINTAGKKVGQARRNKDGQYVYHKFTINPSNKPDIRGVFKYGELPAEGVSLLLLDEDDHMIQFTTTGENGEFQFRRLDPGTSYKVKVDVAENEKVPDNANLYLIDETTGLLMPVSKLANGEFKFETLAPIPAEELELMDDEDYDFKPLTDLTGQVYSHSKNVSAGIDVQVVDVNGKVIAVAKTNDRGTFKFFNLPAEDQYLFQIPNDDPSFGIRMINTENELIGLARKNENNQYVYYKFSANPSDDPDIRGLFKYGTLPANDVLLNLVDENDDIIQFTRTNAAGAFEFTKLSEGKKYQIQVDKSEGQVPSNANMFIQDKHTGLMLPVSKLSNGAFEFETLKAIEADELELMEEEAGSLIRFSFLARLMSETSEVEGKKINIIDGSGNTIGSAVADKYGRFEYKNLPLRDEYLMQMEEDDGSFSMAIINSNGNELGRLDKNEKGAFLFERSELNKASNTSDNKALKAMSPDFEKTMYFKFNMSQLTGEQLRNLDHLVFYMKQNPESNVVVSSHTDSKGTKEYNMNLSEKRAYNVFRYLKGKGIKEERITANSFGESQLLNECADNVDCPEEKHAVNRRVELDYTK